MGTCLGRAEADGRSEPLVGSDGDRKNKGRSVGTVSTVHSEHSGMHPLSAGEIDGVDSSWSRSSRANDDTADRLGLAQARASQQLVAARMQEVRLSWQARPAQPSEGSGVDNDEHAADARPALEHIADRARAEQAFEDVIVDAVLQQIICSLKRRRRAGGLEAAFIVVGLSEFLNRSFEALVRGTDARLQRQFDAFAPHSPVCMCYYVMDAAVAVVEAFMEDDDARGAVEAAGGGKLKKAAQARLRGQLCAFLEEFVRDNEYDPFGHACGDASVQELRRLDAAGELQPLFRIGAASVVDDIEE